jgi:hypothetical protein
LSQRSVFAIKDRFSPFFFAFLAFDNRTKSAREIWRQMQATRYHRANPTLKINTDVSGTPAAPEVVFKLIDDTEVCDE